MTENRDMLDSFAVIASELRSLSENLRNAEETDRKLKLEREEANAKIRAAEAAAEEANNARQVAERLTAETLERAAEEARRIASENQKQKQKAEEKSVAAQTEQQREEVDAAKSVVQETITKEIHIVHKVCPIF